MEMSNKQLEIALSPCPNDVFIISGLLLNKIPSFLNLSFHFEDIETLNQLALNKKYPVIKASFAIWKDISPFYELLPVGSALGFGVGPLIISKNFYSVKDFPNLKIAIPGKHTTAHLLFNFFYSGNIKKIFVRYNQIIPMVLENKTDLGILIHEGRFIYKNYGLKALVDLGKFWEEKTNAPLPLGGFFIKKGLKFEIKKEIVKLLRSSIEWAKNNWETVFPVLQKYAQELDENTIKNHVDTYVNEYTSELKSPAIKGLKVLAEFLKMPYKLEEIIFFEV